MVNSEYNPDKYENLKISIEVKIKNPEMLRFVLYHVKTKKMCKYAVTNVPFLIRYVPARCNKVILENDVNVKFWSWLL